MARKRRQALTSGATILVVDDQPEVLTSVQQVLEREGHRVLVAESGARALEMFRAEPCHLLLVDYFMPRMTGEQLVGEIRKLDPEVQLILQTGYSGDKPPREMLRDLDIQGYHDKTEGPDRLLVWVDVALKAHAQMRHLRQAEQLKSQILNNVSHEFRTPLHIVLGYTELLRDDADPTAGETLERIRRSAQSLLDLVNDFLHLSELDMGRVRAQAEPFTRDDLDAEIERLGTTLAAGTPVAFERRVSEDFPGFMVDHTKLQVIFRSLVSNAVKFGGSGGLAVHASCDDDWATFTVRDAGPGIAPEHHERIFEPFFQIDGGLTRKRDGAGIGLTIARRLARLMGGDIAVASEPGAGATFTLTLPRTAVGPRVNGDAGVGVGATG